MELLKSFSRELAKAVEIASLSEGKIKVGAIVFNKRGRILSIGNNRYLKTHPLQKKCAEKADAPSKVYLHAEIDALVKCKSESAYGISVARVNSKGEVRLAKPCKICQIAIKEAKIKLVEFTTNNSCNSYFVQESFREK
jgi:deoxycytidylate deaminase